jgi:hypothetical protein
MNRFGQVAPQYGQIPQQYGGFGQPQPVSGMGGKGFNAPISQMPTQQQLQQAQQPNPYLGLAGLVGLGGATQMDPRLDGKFEFQQLQNPYSQQPNSGQQQRPTYQGGMGAKGGKGMGG